MIAVCGEFEWQLLGTRSQEFGEVITMLIKGIVPISPLVLF